jgi:hypothetical protein
LIQEPPCPPAARGLAAELAAPLPGVRGDAEAARIFAEAWRDRTGAAPRTDLEARVYRLGTLTPRLPAPPGRARTAGPADRALLLRWQEGFAQDIGEPLSDPARASGAEDVLLVADLANPISTGLYQRLGYVPVRDQVSISFTGPGGEAVPDA